MIGSVDTNCFPSIDEMNKKLPPDKTNRDELLVELQTLRLRLELLESAEAERRQAVEALRESEEKYRILLTNPVIRFSCSTQMALIAMSTGLLRMVIVITLQRQNPS